MLTYGELLIVEGFRPLVELEKKLLKGDLETN